MSHLHAEWIRRRGRVFPYFVILALLASSLVMAGNDGLDQEGLANVIHGLNLCNDFATRGHGKCESPDSNFKMPVKRKERSFQVDTVSIKDKFGNRWNVSVVDVDDLENVHRIYAGGNRSNDDEVFYCRAHVIGERLGKAGLQTVKLYLDPCGQFTCQSEPRIIPDDATVNKYGVTPSWKDHIVNVIYVREKSGEISEYVIDPFMKGTGVPIPKKDFEQRLQSNSKSSIAEKTYLGRFDYGPRDRHPGKTEYDWTLKKCEGIMRGDAKEKDSFSP